MKHRNYDAIVAWAAGEVVQFNLGDRWHDFVDPNNTPHFCYGEWRVKPRLMHATAMDGTVVEWPEPMRVAPDVGTEYWMPVPTTTPKNEPMIWDGDGFDKWLLGNGWCHATEENAAQHAKALAILTRGGKP